MLAPLALLMTITRVLCLSYALLVPVSLYQTWFYEHKDNPYPEKVEKSDLSIRTGLSTVSRYHVLKICLLKFSITKSFFHPKNTVIDMYHFVSRSTRGNSVRYDITLILSGTSHTLVQ